LPSGACGDDTNVAYVDPAGTGADCTKASPCLKVDDAVKTGRPFVKLHGVTDEQVSLNNATVTFLADPGAKLTSTSNGILLKVDGASQVTIHDLEIGGASGTNNPGISLQPGTTSTVNLIRVTLADNAGAGVVASGGTLSASQCTISGNTGVGIATSGGATATVSQSTISGNAAGGLSIGDMSPFSITNNFIYRNGNTISPIAGGIILSGFTADTNTLEFNTIVDNQAKVSSVAAGGVFCDQPGFVAAHNIVFRNTGGTVGNAQTVGSCMYGDSINMPGASNVDNPFGFAHPNAVPFDYHLTPDSPSTVVDAAGACTGIDFDGDTRPVGGACDLGADERKP
jgi:hypothetical protein